MGKKSKSESKSEDGKKKKDKKKDKSDESSSKKKKKDKSEKSDKSEGEGKKKKEKKEKKAKKEKKKKDEDGGSSKKKKSDDEESVMSDVPMKNVDKIRKSVFVREEKLKQLREENAPIEEQFEEMMKDDIDDKIDDLEHEVKKLKKTIEKQKDKKKKLPPEAQLMMQNDWLGVQIREWQFKIDCLESKFELVKKAHQNAVGALQEAQVRIVNQQEMHEMRETLRNKKNDLYEAQQLIAELQKVAWTMLPPKVGQHCQEVEEKMASAKKKLDQLEYEKYKLKMEKVSYDKELNALKSAIDGMTELESILLKKIDQSQSSLDALNVTKMEHENIVTNGYSALETANITYAEALEKAQSAPAEPSEPVEEKTEEKSDKKGKKGKKDKKEKKKKEKKKKKKEGSEASEGGQLPGAHWEEKSAFLQTKLKEIEAEMKTIKTEVDKAQKEQAGVLDQIKKQKETKEAIEKLKKDKEAFGTQLQQEVVLRKTYYNQIEDLKGKIRVFSRCRPISKSELDRGNKQCVSFPDKYTVAVHGVTKDNKPKEFQFDLVFPPETDQPDVFVDTSRLIQSAFDGFNVCIFAYGQTGSGKTHTLIGNLEKAPGIAPRSFVRLFEVVNEGKAKFTAKLNCYMLELYNEKLLDLMANNAEYSDKLEIKKDQHGMVIVPGAELLSARTADELRDLFLKGNGNRHIASTKMNSESSRSHLIISIMIECTQQANGKIVRGKMSIIDLAGSERLAKSGVKGVGATEATAINMSLSALGDVISALTSGQPFVPYRNNKLTLLMQDSLGGNAKTLMFVNLSPVDYNATETVNSLTYAQRVKLIKNDATKVADAEEIPKLQKIIDKLVNGENIEDFQALMQ